MFSLTSGKDANLLVFFLKILFEEAEDLLWIGGGSTEVFDILPSS